MKLASSKPLSRTARFFRPHLIFVFLFFALAANAEKIQDIHPTGYVTDLAGVINADTKTRLENLCLELEQKTGAQMAIVTVRSLEGQDVDQYGNDSSSSSVSETRKTIAASSCSSRPPNAPTASK